MNDNNRNEFNVAFGSFVKEARISKGFAQGDVARQLGLSHSYYNYIENGGRNVDLQLAIKICKHLNLDLKDFMESIE